MRGGVIDEPFHRNIIAVETNTTVRSKVRERYLNFRRGSDLVQNISCNQSQICERMTFKLLNDFESNSDMDHG